MYILIIIIILHEPIKEIDTVTQSVFKGSSYCWFAAHIPCAYQFLMLHMRVSKARIPGRLQCTLSYSLPPPPHPMKQCATLCFECIVRCV